jgi:Stigma-specific protein, Stig1
MTRSLLIVAALAALTTLSGCHKETTCPVGEVLCAGQCVDPTSDAANCGACGVTCDARATCQRGACDCAPGLSACGTACIDLASDPAHCGACGIACFGTVCSAATGPAICSASCGAGETDCGGACVRLDQDRFHCGACGTACAAGESCVEGGCASLQVACFSTNDVRAVAPDLATRGSTRPAGTGPIALTALGADVWAAASLSGSLVRLPLDLAAPSAEFLLHGNDFEYITTHAGRLLLSNAGAGTVVIADPATGAVAGEIPVGSSAGENIKGIAFAQATGGGGVAFVSLQGDAVSGNPALGQKIAVLDAAGLATCGVAGSPLPCLGAPTYLDVSAGADAPGLAFPGRSVAFGNKVYVVLANLMKGSFGYFTDPAGPGKLAVVDPTGPSVSYLSLGACGNPGGIAVHGQSLWVACSAFGGSGLVEVNLSGPAPVVGDLHPVPVMAPGNVAFCGTRGFVTDQWSGDVYPFDAMDFASSPPAAFTVCPVSAGKSGYAWAADVACASRP